MTDDYWVEKIAQELCGELCEWPLWHAQSERAKEKYMVAARKTVATLRRPEFVLPIAEELLLDNGVRKVRFMVDGGVGIDIGGDESDRLAEDWSLLECYLSLRGAV